MSAQGQKAALKTNVLYDAFMNINVGMEVGLAPRWTLDITGDFNAWTLSHDRRWKHWIVQPEARLWFCDRFAGHFLGFHAHGGQYNAGGLKNGISFLGSDLSKLSDYRYQGWFVGAGAAWICLDTGTALEPGSRDRRGLRIHPIRPVPLRRLREKTRNG